jgi:hypothetical protein
METPIYKCDLICAAKDIFPAYPSFKSWMEHIVKQALSEASLPVNDEEVERLVEENSFIRFSTHNIPFTIKVV